MPKKKDLRYEDYVRFVESLVHVSRMSKEELQAAKQKNGQLEQMVDDDCKRALFRDFAKGAVTQQYADGFLTALAVRKTRTYPDWKETE